jgi:hypothetical protein
VSGSAVTTGCGGPIVASRSSAAAVTTGHGRGEVNIAIVMPKPNVNVSTSRTMIDRVAGTVSDSAPSV